MRDDEASPARGGMLGQFGLAPHVLLTVAGLTLCIWMYYDSIGERLDTSETAAVLIGLAAVTALGLAIVRIAQRVIARRRAMDDQTPP